MARKMTIHRCVWSGGAIRSIERSWRSWIRGPAVFPGDPSAGGGGLIEAARASFRQTPSGTAASTPSAEPSSPAGDTPNVCANANGSRLRSIVQSEGKRQPSGQTPAMGEQLFPYIPERTPSLQVTTSPHSSLALGHGRGVGVEHDAHRRPLVRGTGGRRARRSRVGQGWVGRP
jgi:hypothetical protein